MSALETMRLWLARIIAVAILAGTLVAVGLVLLDRERVLRSDVAEIDAPVLSVSATVPGRIIAFHVENNATVNRGDLLFEIDPEPYRLLLEQAQAELAATESEVRQGERNITTAQTNAQVAEEQIARALNNLQLAQQTLDRLEPLLPQGYVTAQEVDTARTAHNDAQVSLDQARQQALAANEIIGTLETRKAAADAARAAVALAERELRNTKVYAPFDGKVVGLSTATGQYVLTAETIFTLINTDAWEAVAYFRETELPRIRIGDAAEVFVLSDPTRPIRGTVSGLGWGVRSDEAIDVLGIPLVDRSLNWVTVARRYPVYIHLDEHPEDLMRIGATAAVVIAGGNDNAVAGE